jgi:hypothetical protein
MVSGKSVGEFSKGVTQGSASNKNSHKRTNVFLYRVCYFIRLSLNLDNIEKILYKTPIFIFAQILSVEFVSWRNTDVLRDTTKLIVTSRNCSMNTPKKTCFLYEEGVCKTAGKVVGRALV